MTMWGAVIMKVAVAIITLPDSISKRIQHFIHVHPTTYLLANPK